jgi:uncharacterized membrane protein
MQRFLYATYVALFTSPLVSLAASVASPKSFKGLVGLVTNVIGTLIVLIFALTFLAFMWGIIRTWIIGAGNAEDIESGKKIALTGVIVLVVMSSLWGILYLFQSSLFK